MGKLFDILHVYNWTYFCMSVHILDCLNLAHHCQCDRCKNRSAYRQRCKCQKLCPSANLDLPPLPLMHSAALLLPVVLLSSTLYLIPAMITDQAWCPLSVPFCTCTIAAKSPLISLPLGGLHLSKYFKYLSIYFENKLKNLVIWWDRCNIQYISA